MRTSGSEPESESSSGSATSASLLLRVRANDPIAWQRLLTLYSPLVAHWCRDLQPEDRADVIQDVFQAVARSLGTFQIGHGSTFRGWLYTITRNKITDLHRRRQHEPPGAGGSEAQQWFQAVAAPSEEMSSIEQTAEMMMLQETLERIRSEFTATSWQAFWRTAVEGKESADVGRELNLSAGAVRVARCRILHRLREELRDAIDPS